MSSNLRHELLSILECQLNPHGYTGHLLSHFDSKKVHLESLIKSTALMSESNSVLILGPSGSGKAALLECVLEKIFKDPAITENMMQVTLNGLIHVDDNIALEDITQQLKLTEVEDNSLGSFSEKLRLLLAALKSGTKASKSVLFILNNFELFASHKDQTLLYNLFDIARSQTTPICVVGLCCRPDVLQDLENRVNSRFSRQEIHLFEDIAFEDYLDAAKHFLSLHTFKDSKFQKRWNSEIACLFKDSAVQKILEHHFNISNTLRDLKDLLYLAVQNMKSSQPKILVEDIEAAYMKYNEDHTANIVSGLSVLEVALVVAMIHLTEIYEDEPFNFEIVYSEVSKFLQNRLKWNIEKSVVKKSFDNLIGLELVKPRGDYSGCNLKNYVLVRQMVNSIEVRKMLENYPNLPGELKNWIESSLNP